MKLNDIISMVKDTTQKISEKKTLKIKDIVLIPEFQKLLVMEEDFSSSGAAKGPFLMLLLM